MNRTAKMMLMANEKKDERYKADGAYAPMRGGDAADRSHLDHDPMMRMGYYNDGSYSVSGRYSGRDQGRSGVHRYGASAAEDDSWRRDDAWNRDDTWRRDGGVARNPNHHGFTAVDAEEWVSHMENEDGTHGAHWTMDQVKNVMAQRKIDCDPIEFYAAMNMMYSDYYKVAKKHGVGNSLDFYVDMAKAFIEDKDAAPDKVYSYYEYVSSR